tara:strand:- start:509 stop:736 length:228 start_codon:yes stop_codon:yes gene_type:complete
MTIPKYTIDKDIQIPMGAGSQGSRKYPWAEMEIGDSIFVTGVKGVKATALSYGNRHGIRFSTRREKNGVRVWRIE